MTPHLNWPRKWFAVLSKGCRGLSWIFLLFFAWQTLSGQEAIKLEGQVINAAGTGIAYAHIISLKTLAATAADPFGKFFFHAYPGDSLLITAMGQHPAIFRIPELAKPGKHPIIVILMPDTIQLSEVIITPWPETWVAFKQAFLELQVPVEEFNLNIPGDALLRAIREARPHGGVVMPGPVSLLYDAFSKEAKRMRKYNSLTRRDHFVARIRGRLGDKLLLQITRSQSIEEVESKLENCILEDEILDQATEMEIIQSILACLSLIPR